MIAFIAIINIFFFPGNYGNLSLQFEFSESIKSNFDSIFLNFLIIIFFVLIVLLRHFKMIIISCLAVVLCTLLVLIGINSKHIYSEFQYYKLQRINDMALSNDPIFHFSKTKKTFLLLCWIRL